MDQIAARELRNDVSAVLRRVEAGEELTITVSGRPTARLVPIQRRPASIPWGVFAEAMTRVAADPALADELAEMLTDTTDDV